jgi:hypothetical protein
VIGVGGFMHDQGMNFNYYLLCNSTIEILSKYELNHTSGGISWIQIYVVVVVVVV